MTKKILLLLGALLVAAMIVGLIVSLRGTESTASTGPSRATDRPPIASGAGTGEGTASPGTQTGATAPPATPVTPEIKRPEPVPPVPEDPAGGPEVRDHRGGGPTAPPSPIKSTTVASVRQVLEPQVRACAEGLAIENPPVRFVAHSTFRAGGGRVTSHGLRITGAEALGLTFADCVGRAYASLGSDVGDEQADGEDLVHMPWSVP